MIFFISRFTVKPDREAEFIRLATALTEKVRAHEPELSITLSTGPMTVPAALWWWKASRTRRRNMSINPRPGSPRLCRR